MSPDDELLERLRAAATEADAPSEHVLAAARGARARVSLDDELLELRFDSFVDAPVTAARSGSGARLLRFGTAECTVELELTGTDPLGVVGQVAPAPDDVELTHAGGVTSVPADDLGRFTVATVPRGPASLAWTAPGGRRVRTTWVAI